MEDPQDSLFAASLLAGGASEQGALIYEVNLEIDPGIAKEFDPWLKKHVAEMLELPGFLAANILTDVKAAGKDSPAWVTRTVQYKVASRDDLENYFVAHASSMRQARVDRFGDAFRAARRILSTDPKLSLYDVAPETHCRNCKAPLTSEFCAVCGQRAHIRIKLSDLLRDSFADLFDADSRLWRSLRPLLFRPGYMTDDYLTGRRMRYLPPFRMYLVLSLLFFLVASFGDEGHGIHIGDDPHAEVEVQADDAEDTTAGDAAAEAADDEDDFDCDDIQTETDFDELLKPICEKIKADKGAAFGRELVDNLPAMMFFFLPVLAVVFKFLYIGSRRYYVEHLVFCLHYHAFFYLIVMLVVAAWQLTEGLGLPEFPAGLLTAVVSIYIPVYLFKAMRRVYHQGFVVTSLKYILLGLAYFVSLLITFLATLAYTALSL